MNLYAGSYTDEGGPGIWFGSLKGDKLIRHFTIKDADNPNYLLLSGDGEALFAVCGSRKNGYFALSYGLCAEGAALISKQAVSGADPCHLVLSGDGKFLFTANYADGSLSVFPVDGKAILPECQFIKHGGRSAHPARQEAPHVHHVSFAPEDKTLLRAVDLGIDAIVAYRFSPESGRLSREGEIRLPPGSGPRHLVYAHSGRRMYVCDELSSEVTFIDASAAETRVHPGVSTLPEGFKGESFCAAIRLSEDEKTLYISNRGHDSIAVFSLLEDGAPKLIRHIPCGGKFPRDFVLLPSGRILVANQFEGGLALIDEDGIVHARADVPGAVAIVY